MAEFPIPEGYYLLGPINTKTAKQALAEAEENGHPAESVLTRGDGFLVPLPREEEEIEFDDTEWVVAHSPNPDRIGLIVASPEDGEEDEEVVSREDFERDAEERDALREQAEATEAQRLADEAEAQRVADEEAAKVAAENEKEEDTEEESTPEPRPDDSWLKPAIEEWAKNHDIDATGTKAEILDRINTQEVK